MSSEDEEEQCAFYGKPLEQYDEDSIPKRRPISVEEQTARDAQGRRRFHGAFTGGFSAGFYNTVGSLEGWKPQEFKSTRSEKAGHKIQKPQDFMDDEDISEFGIAPQTVKATKDYNTSKKRKRKGFSDGPIPGEPVLHTLIESNTETIGYLLLRHMGFKHTPDEEQEEELPPEEVPQKRIYGCEMPKPVEIKPITTTNLHKVYESALKNPKDNTFGLGYLRLEKQHGHLMTSSNLIVKDRNNKTLSIAGQAFGVGAFEEDDDDIYSKEDMSNYDFEMSKESKKVEVRDSNNLTVKMFVSAKISLGLSEVFLPPSIPKSFMGKHMVRKSRFEPVKEDKVEKIVRRCDKNADYRAGILGEQRKEELSEVRKDNRVEVLSDIRFNEPNPSSSRLNSVDDDDERETKVKVEPLGASGLIFDRFVSAGKSEEHTNIMEQVESTQHGTKDMREAARMKMFGTLTRFSTSWIPNSIVCKRFNVPEPVFSDMEMKPRKRTRNLIFENETFSETPESNHNSGLQMRKQDSSANNDVIDLEMIPIPNDNQQSSHAGETSKINKNVNNDHLMSYPNKTNAHGNTNRDVRNETKEITSQSEYRNTHRDVRNETKEITSQSENQQIRNSQVEQLNVIKNSESDSIVPKKSLDPTEKLDISKNADLFKAIFQDSDDEEEEDAPTKIEETRKDHEEELKRDSTIKEQILSDELFLPKIKPIKEGILSNVDLIVFKKPVKKEIVEEPVPDLYGPKLPEKINLDSKKSIMDGKKFNDEVEDDWVVKGEESDKKDRKHKKNKKHKKKHKRKRD